MADQTEERKLLDNGMVEITTISEVPRYEGRIYSMPSNFYEEEVKLFIERFPITTFYRDYKTLNSFEFGNDEDDETYSLSDYQKALDKHFGKGKYEAYILGAYIHGGTSFSISKFGDNRCKWDSSNLGFIGIPVDTNEKIDVNKVAQELTDLYEGNYYEFCIYDNYTEEIIDSIVSSEVSDQEVIKMKNEYKIDSSNILTYYN